MRKLYIYLHTHWDREWYRPFETFRASLPSLVGSVLDGLESGQLPSFYLDGQAVLLEDAIAIAPQLASRLGKQMALGRLSAGPWYVLPDQILVGGESLIRNLRLGIATTSSYGPPAMVGYCPDSFGHSNDLPRVLAGFDINSAVVWRGVGKLDSSPLFWWESAGGCRVLAYHLTRGYYQSALHEKISVPQLSKFLSDWVAPESFGLDSPYCKLIDGALFPCGCDHLGPALDASEKIQQVNAQMSLAAGTDSCFQAVVVTLPEFLDKINETAAVETIQCVIGELRDNSLSREHGSAYLLGGVVSSRLYLKRENRLAEHRLVHICEPLLSLLNLAGATCYPSSELERAWKLLLKNHPHDSICGCSVDAVHDEMQTRTSKINGLLDALEERAELACLTNTSKDASQVSPRDPAWGPKKVVVYNLSTQAVSAPVRLKWASEINELSVKSNPDIQLISRVRREELFGTGKLVPYYKDVFLNESWVWAETVPGLGCRQLDWTGCKPKQSHSSPVSVSTTSISNGLLELTVKPDGDLLVTLPGGRQCHIGHKLQDLGDGGDTYNFDPLEADLPIKAVFRSSVPAASGPLVASLVITYEIDIPTALVERSGKLPVRSLRRRRHRITTEVSLRRGVPIVFFETVWENRCRDHRLEVMLDTGAAVSQSLAESHFSLVRRLHSQTPPVLPVEPGSEAPLDRFPSQRFFAANSQLFFNTGLPEYGVDGSAVAITLLRAVSILSQGRIRTRGGGAGPHLPVAGANCLGLNHASYGWAPLESVAAQETVAVADNDLPWLPDSQSIEAYQLAEQFEGCLWATMGSDSGEEKRFLSLDNVAIRLVSLYTDSKGDNFFVRLLNVTNHQQECKVDLLFNCLAASLCNLAEAVQQVLPVKNGSLSDCQDQNVIQLVFQPNELITVKLEAR